MTWVLANIDDEGPALEFASSLLVGTSASDQTTVIPGNSASNKVEGKGMPS